jgi:hypothetical protein
MESIIAQLEKVNAALQQEVQTSRDVMGEEKSYYLQNLILYQHLKGLIEDGSETSGSERKALSTLESLLSGAEAMQYVSEDGLVLGVIAEDLEQSEQDQDQVARAVIPLLEKSLQQTSEQVVQFAGAASLDKLVVEASSSHESLAALRTELEELREGWIRAGGELLGLLGGAWQKLRYEEGREALETQVTWLAAQAEGMEAKMHLLEKRGLKETYYGKEVMLGLRKLYQALVQAKAGAEQRRDALLLRKKQFGDAGEEMEALAQEYAEVLKTIQETEWSLKELKK